MQSLIDAGLSRPWYRLALPEALEAMYRAETAPASGRYVQSWLGIFMLVNVVSLIMDLDAFGSRGIAVPVTATLSVFYPVTLLTILSLQGRPSLLRQSIAGLIPALVEMAIVLNSARLVSPEYTSSYVILAGVVPLVVGLVALLPFRHSLWFSGASMTLYAGLVVAFGLGGPGLGGIPMLVAGLILFPVKLSYSREREAKRCFLIGLRERVRAEELARANARLTALAEADPLTAVANRRHFSEGLEAAWMASQDRNEWLGVLLIDIDRFALLNDAAGHAEGDRCLIQVATALRIAVEARGGLVGRHGGEEFVAFLPRTDLAIAGLAGESIRAAVARLAIKHPGLPEGCLLSVSVGVTAAHGRTRGSDVSSSDLLRAAGFALDAARSGGRDRVASFQPAHTVGVPRAPTVLTAAA